MIYFALLYALGGTEKLERLIHIGRLILPDLLVSYGLA